MDAPLSDFEKIIHVQRFRLHAGNGRGALAEYPEFARVDSARDREGRERPHSLPALQRISDIMTISL